MWRKFNFFEKTIVQDKDDTISQLNVTSCTNGRGHIIFGDVQGKVHIMDRTLKTDSFSAFQQRVNHVKHVKPNFLVVIGDEGKMPPQDSDIIKIYNLDKIDPRSGEFLLVKELRPFARNTRVPSSPVTFVDVAPDFSCIALGLGNGVVILFQGDLAKGRGIQLRLLPGDGKRITGLHFRKLEDDGGYCLFCVTPQSVYKYTIGKSIEPLKELDIIGCESGCSTLSNDGDLVIAQREGVWFYKPDGKGPCFGFEGKKLMIKWFRSYLVCISSDYNRHNNLQQVITIYDLKNKYIAFKHASERIQVTHIIHEWGSLVIILKERASPQDTIFSQKLYVLDEKDTQTKLETLFQKNLYTIAISLVNNRQLDQAYVTDIFRKYGDHLYSKKDYDSAMQQYLRTIGKLEPSYVIRKFLDAQRIHNLTSYLEALHEHNLATADHTTLLLNCYTKLKDEKKEKLDKFIKMANELHYDVDTAIRVCRSAGYREHALLLAQMHNEYNWYLKIMTEDYADEPFNRNYKKALKFIESLPFDKAEHFLKQYGKVLVTKLPKQTTNVLIRLCTDYYPIPQSEYNRTLYSDHKQRKFEILNKSEKKDNLGDLENVYDTTNIQKSKSEDFIHAFATQPFWLMVFLENVIMRNPSKPPQVKIVYNTLLELYMQNINVPKKEKTTNEVEPYREENVKEEFEDTEDKDVYEIYPTHPEYHNMSFKEKMLQILENPDSNYDTEFALVLVQTHNFKEGILKMYERLGLHYDIIQYYMEQKEYDNLIKACIEHGDKDPNMWIQVLSYFANGEEDFDEQISFILQKIEKDNILPPLLVIQILSKKPKTKLGVIKDYLAKKLQQEQMLIAEDLEKIKETQTETAQMRKEVEELRTSAKIFQLNTCSLCNSPLDLPAVHFMCYHSYHQRCLVDLDECPQCSKKHREVLQRIKKYEESSDQHEMFFKQLKNSAADGFSVVAEYFGRGIFKTNFDDLQYLVYDTDDEEEDERKELFDDDDDDFDEN